MLNYFPQNSVRFSIFLLKNGENKELFERMFSKKHDRELTIDY